MSHNRLGDAGLRAFAGSLATGALERLKQLYLNENLIGDDGMVALAQAVQPTVNHPEGTLAKCEVLTLGYNQIGERGVMALAAACEQGALHSMERFVIACNKFSPAREVIDAAIASARPMRDHLAWRRSALAAREI